MFRSFGESFVCFGWVSDVLGVTPEISLVVGFSNYNLFILVVMDTLFSQTLIYIGYGAIPDLHVVFGWRSL